MIGKVCMSISNLPLKQRPQNSHAAGLCFHRPPTTPVVTIVPNSHMWPSLSSSLRDTSRTSGERTRTQLPNPVRTRISHSHSRLCSRAVIVIDTINNTGRQVAAVDDAIAAPAPAEVSEIRPTPPHAEFAILVARGQGRVGVVFDPGSIRATFILVPGECGLPVIVIITSSRSRRSATNGTNRGSDQKPTLLWPKRTTELGKMQEENPLKHLPVLRARTVRVARILHDTGAAQAGPVGASRIGPAGGGHDSADEVVAVG